MPDVSRRHVFILALAAACVLTLLLIRICATAVDDTPHTTSPDSAASFLAAVVTTATPMVSGPSTSRRHTSHDVETVARVCYASRFGGDPADAAAARADAVAVTAQSVNAATGSMVVATLGATTGCLSVELLVEARASSDAPKRWTHEAATQRLAEAAGVAGSYRGTWSEGHVLARDGLGADARVVAAAPFFMWPARNASAGAADSQFTRGGRVLDSHAVICDRSVTESLSAVALDVVVFELFRESDAVAETAEELAVRYFTSMAGERVAVRLTLPSPSGLRSPQPLRPRRLPAWRVSGRDTIDYERDARFRGYWLRFRGDTTRGAALSLSHDLLGRMDLRAGLRLADGSDASGAPRLGAARSSFCAVARSPAPCARECFLRALQHTSLVFVGDSHVRTLYYGLLSRLGVAFAANRVWRGGHEAFINASSTTLAFVPSSFLELPALRAAIAAAKDRAAAAAAAAAAASRLRVVVVAGLGQHHSTHCYALSRHASSVRAALDALAAEADGHRALPRRPFVPVWFGVPAQPVNRHLFAPKPVGQSRRDCRSNARHLLYSAVQQHLCAQRGVRFLDSFALSAGIAHTSIDGAHFYSFARDAMLDELATLVADA
jgi:hypothetical protein